MNGMSTRATFAGHDVFVIPSGNETCLLYAPTLKLLIRVANRLAHAVRTHGLDNPDLDRGINKLNLLFTNNLGTAIVPDDEPLKQSKYFHLALGLTRNCTLRCVYCHAEAGININMQYEVIHGAIRHAFHIAESKHLKGVNVSFAVGGEPTSRWGLFTSCIQAIRDASQAHCIPTQLSMTTNGFYGDRKREYIAQNIDNILVSIDGPPEIQNLHRPARLGSNSYGPVRDSVLYFIKHARSVAIRSTISSVSVKRMDEIVNFFAAEFGTSYDLVFEPLVPLGRAQTVTSIISEPNQHAFVENCIRAMEAGCKLGVKIKTSALNNHRLIKSFCGAMAFPSFTVTPLGVVTTCERDSDGSAYGYGYFDVNKKEFVINEERIEANRLLLQIPNKCADCFCKWHCAGDCPDIRTIGYDRCFVIRSLVQYELERMNGKNLEQTKEDNDEGKRITC